MHLRRYVLDERVIKYSSFILDGVEVAAVFVVVLAPIR